MKNIVSITRQPAPNEQFQSLTRLEESIRKNRGLTFLLTRAMATGDNPINVPGELDHEGIYELSEGVTREVDVYFNEVFQAMKNAKSSDKTAHPAA